MGLIDFCKKGFKKKSEKTVAKRRAAEFRGLGLECTASELIKKYTEFPHTTFLETIGLTDIIEAKGDLFSFEILEKDFETGANILSKCHTASSLLRLHKRWLVQSGKCIPERQLQSLVNRRLEESKAVTEIIKKAMVKMDEDKEHWITNALPATTGECFTATLYCVEDYEFTEPYLHTCEYLGNGKWDCPHGFYVAAWKDEKPYIPSEVEELPWNKI